MVRGWSWEEFDDPLGVIPFALLNNIGFVWLNFLETKNSFFKLNMNFYTYSANFVQRIYVESWKILFLIEILFWSVRKFLHINKTFTISIF